MMLLGAAAPALARPQLAGRSLAAAPLRAPGASPRAARRSQVQSRWQPARATQYALEASPCDTARNLSQVISRQPIAQGRALPALQAEGRSRSSLVVKAEAGAVAALSGKTKKKSPFPFTKIVGQEDLKLALILCLVDPSIGGVLIMGDRGTGKSMAVRSLTNLLPELDVVEGDFCNSDPNDSKLMGPDALARARAGETLPALKMRTPLVELPLGATEDRICGTIDIEKALQEGVKAFEPGLLARANRGILYVDEVNLLEDSLVDLVLDSAASGVNTVEREGISIIHPAKFVLVGSGNPQEGEMRPQLLDRFGMSVTIGTIMDNDMRVELVQNRMAYERDAEAFAEEAKADMDALRDKIVAARASLTKVTTPADLKLKISECCSALEIDGLRGDITVNRVARALVAYEGRTEVELHDVDRVISMSLAHRMRKDPLSDIDGGTKVQLVWNRCRDPEAFAREQAEKEAKKQEAFEKQKAEAAAAKERGEVAQDPEKRKGMKKGAWTGLPF
ncbi:unnamed protein product [Pedinophyceae sp. YPF-701]|nr:unnamed protein product [Pedinophyceae sp. YPF-701]